MMMIIPKGYSKLRDKIKQKINDIVQEENISWRFALDSEGIKDSIDTLTSILWRLKTESKPELDRKTLKEFEEMKKLSFEKISKKIANDVDNRIFKELSKK